jgi:hypothetical protein
MRETVVVSAAALVAAQCAKQDDLDFDFNHARSRASLAKGDELFVAMPDGECRRRA